VLCMSDLTHSHFGGFLLHRGWFRPSLATQTRALPSTGDNAVSPRQNINCADHIGVVFVATAYAFEMRLRWPIFGCHPIAVGTRAARVVWRHRDQHCTIPVHLVLQLAPELGPALVENGFVQARFGPNMLTCLLRVACCRAGHIAHLQVLDTHHRVVLADRGSGPVQVGAANITDTSVDSLDFRLSLRIANLGQHLAAVPEAQPARLGQADAAVPLLLKTGKGACLAKKLPYARSRSRNAFLSE
jgi:hypothetical protein